MLDSMKFDHDLMRKGGRPMEEEERSGRILFWRERNELVK